MPITVTPPLPNTGVTPGTGIHWVSDFIGPLPTGTTAELSIFTAPPGEALIWSVHQTTQVASGFLSVMTHVGQNPQLTTTAWPQNGDQLLTVVTLRDSVGNTIDSGSATLPWHPTDGLGAQVFEQPQGQSGGLTSDQALELSETHSATWPEHLVDQLTTQALGHGSSSLPIAANLTTPVFGVIVRLTAVPEDLAPGTPDGDYWLPTLAVVRIFRGSDLWLRVPIHTSSKLVNLWIEGLALGLADAVLNAGWLLNLTLQVFFLEGVEGDVLLMRVP